MKKKFSTMKLQNRFLLILLLALTISATLFELLWLNKWTLVNWTGNFEILQSQIDDENKRSDELSEYEKYVKTKKFVEEIAKNKFGLIYPDELIFKPNNK